MRIERPVIAWSSCLQNRQSTCSNRRCFYKQTADLSFKKLQALAVVARHVWCRHGVTHLWRRRKSNLAVRLQAFCSLSSLQHWKPDLILYLHRSFLPYRSADVFLVCFLIRHIYLSVTQLVCSLNYISSISWVDMPLTADWLHVYFGTRPRLSFLKRFRKMSYPAFKCTSCAVILYTVSSCNLAWLNPPVHSLITCKTLLIT